MNDFQYQLNGALPFELDSVSPEADALWNAAVKACPHAEVVANAFDSTHEDVCGAYDVIGEWIAANWRTVLPEIAARF